MSRGAVNPALKRHLQWASHSFCFNPAELCLLGALPIGTGAAADVQHEVGNKPDTDINAGFFAVVTREHDSSRQSCASPRSRRDGCELRKARCCRAGRGWVAWSRTIPFKFGSERQAPGSLQLLRKAG